MGLEQVQDEILEEAEQKANKIVEEAEEEAEEIVSDAEQKAELIEEEAEREIEEKKESIRKKKLSNARMEARQLKLGKKQEKLDEAFESFREELEKLDEEDRQEFLQSCLDRVNFEVGTVKASRDFRDAVEEEGFDFKESSSAGVILESEDGERRQNFSFDKIVENYRERYRKRVAETLFE